jgi:hypothetical protein
VGGKKNNRKIEGWGKDKKERQSLLRAGGWEERLKFKMGEGIERGFLYNNIGL